MEISGVHTEVSPKLRKYVTKKLGRMDRFLPKKSREAAHLEVKLKELQAKSRKQFTCEVILHLPHDTITIAETTVNIFAAVDIVETKLKNQIKRYKEKNSRRALGRRLIRKIRINKNR
jgi:putative sigma-54 modulation protein